MKDLNFNVYFKDATLVDSSEKMNELLSNLCAQFQGGDSVKLWGWAIELRRSGNLMLDASDTEKLKEVIKGGKLTAMGEAQLLEVLIKE